MVKVGIYDKVSTIVKYEMADCKIKKAPDYILSTDKKILENPDDLTFQKIFAKDNMIFSLTLSGGDKYPDLVKWMRFEKILDLG